MFSISASLALFLCLGEWNETGVSLSELYRRGVLKSPRPFGPLERVAYILFRTILEDDHPIDFSEGG